MVKNCNTGSLNITVHTTVMLEQEPNLRRYPQTLAFFPHRLMTSGSINVIGWLLEFCQSIVSHLTVYWNNLYPYHNFLSCRSIMFLASSVCLGCCRFGTAAVSDLPPRLGSAHRHGIVRSKSATQPPQPGVIAGRHRSQPATTLCYTSLLHTKSTDKEPLWFLVDKCAQATF